jgi:hypothetical protein
MERKTGTASTDEKETLRIAKVMKQNVMITTRRKNSNSGVMHPEKTCCAVYRKPKEQDYEACAYKSGKARCTEKRKNKPVKQERRTSPVQRVKCLRWYDF